MCGELTATASIIWKSVGSPPRVWGIVGQAYPMCAECRFTPTCVGNWEHRQQGCTTTSVHPHVCGELSTQPRDISRADGSPPRVWGIAVSVILAPALLSVHPHVCGELYSHDPIINHHYGSPPRVWGIESGIVTRTNRHRFTPTCVGNWLLYSPVSSSVTVHPHVCGELVIRP